MKKTLKDRVQEAQAMYNNALKSAGLTKFKTIAEETELFECSGVVIKSSQTCEYFLRRIYNDLGSIEIYETFLAMYLNRRNQIIGYAVISSGGVAGTVVDQRFIFKHAVNCLASGVILCHNHPSGNLQPSQTDKEITRKLKQAGIILEIPILDHVILVPGTGYFSFADEGMI
jgi:DNA repair protein RadC